MEITLIRSLISRDDAIVGFLNLEMIYISGIPYAVFEWGALPDGETIPILKVELHPDMLQPLPAGGEVAYQYQVSIEDPRLF